MECDSKAPTINKELMCDPCVKEKKEKKLLKDKKSDCRRKRYRLSIIN